MAEVKPTATPNAPAANPDPNAVARNQAAANQTAENVRQQQDKNRDDASKRLDDEDQKRHEANLAKEEAMANMKPTPTQRENDLAKMGHPVDEKEDDGSGPEVLPGQARDAQSNDSAKYKTREMGNRK